LLFEPLEFLQFIREEVSCWWAVEKGSEEQWNIFRNVLFQQGRYLWKFTCFNKRMKDILEFAIEKLNTGVEVTADSQMNDGLALAVLACRVSLFFHASMGIAETLIHSHMAICLKVSDDRNYFWATYPSEPLLSLAASTILKQGHWSNVIKKLIPFVKNGMVEAGFRGEMICKIILSIVWDSLQKELCVQTSVKVKDFLKALGGDLLLEEINKANCQDQSREMILDAEIYFTHFVYLTYNVTEKKELEYFAKNGQAVFCRFNQTAIDLMLPIILNPGSSKSAHISFIVVQCKNINNANNAESKSINEFMRTADPSSFHFTGWDSPYLSLLMSIGPKQVRRRHIECLNSISSTKTFSSKKAILIAMYDLCEETYPLLNKTGVLEVLKKLRETFNDPISQIKDDRQLDMFKNLMKPIYLC
jgi:hypothetical protein